MVSAYQPHSRRILILHTCCVSFMLSAFRMPLQDRSRADAASCSSTSVGAASQCRADERKLASGSDPRCDHANVEGEVVKLRTFRRVGTMNLLNDRTRAVRD
jgi:hypothetical protein